MLSLPTASVMACLWDSDTLHVERATFPEVSFLITGTFSRHSREYYEWLRTRCEKHIQEFPHRHQLYDDLAVAQHKLVDHKAAIATMQAKERIRPGLYETYSNLGTFLIYTGELAEARAFIEKALSINTNARFGREKYQLWLIEWVTERHKPAPDMASKELTAWYQVLRYGFAAIVARHSSGVRIDKTSSFLTPQQQAEAIRGISGMMRFADFDNPLLLEALGDVLNAGEEKPTDRKLAALAYLHASRKAADDAEKQRLHKRFEILGEKQRDGSALEDLLTIGLDKGRAYAESIRQDELAWIASGKDASAEFQKKYLAAR